MYYSHEVSIRICMKQMKQILVTDLSMKSHEVEIDSIQIHILHDMLHDIFHDISH